MGADRVTASIERLLLPHIHAMEPYAPILPFEVLSAQLGREPWEIVKLDANENPYGPHPSVGEALRAYDYFHIYPDPEQRALRDALAAYTGAPAENILPGHGADELIDLLTRIMVGPGDAVIDCPPTFGMYGFDAGLAGAQVVKAPRRENFHLDVPAIQKAASEHPNAKLLFLTSPNNPDGSLLGTRDLAALLRLPLFVVVDEAYIEFAGLKKSVADWVLVHENLAVLRTFSKWAGLAGLRLGYGVFPSWLMPHLWKAKQPYNVNVAATVAGLASLRNRAEIQSTIDALIKERERLLVELGRVPFLEPIPSHANFVLCRVMGRDARELKEALARAGVLVRYYSKLGLENMVRVSAGRPEDTDRLMDALGRV
jgi:histidinol-phosphate aminotransferase